MNTITINFLGKSVTLSFVEHRYRDNGRLALEAVDALTGEPFGMVTVNLDTPLADNEVCVKVWSENAAWVPQVLEALKWEYTGRDVPTGFVRAPVYKIAS
jgi:hypothetical protein